MVLPGMFLGMRLSSVFAQNFTSIYFFKLVFQKYDPNFVAASLDEAYLDITNVCKERGITSGEVSSIEFECKKH